MGASHLLLLARGSVKFSPHSLAACLQEQELVFVFCVGKVFHLLSSLFCVFYFGIIVLFNNFWSSLFLPSFPFQDMSC